MKKFEDDGQWFKYCPGCNHIFPVVMFYEDKGKCDNLQSSCSWCQKERVINWYANNKEKKIKYTRAWMKDNPEKHKKNKRKCKNKRKRNLGYMEIWKNNWPEDIPIHYHHINNLIVIPFPAITHMKTLGKNHRKDMNEMFKKYYMIDIDELLGDEI